MTKVLITSAFVVDLDEDEHFAVVVAVDEAIREQLRKLLVKHDITAEQLDDNMDYFGTHIHLRWDMNEYLASRDG